jgi:hypothetical protein
MKVRPLFDKYQRYLLSFANTKIGRQYLGLYKWFKINHNLPILKITPDSTHFYLGKENGKHYCQAVFHSKSQYLKKFQLALEGLEIANNFIGRIYQPDLVIPHFQGLTYVNWLPKLMRSTLTQNPDAHPETTTADDGPAYDAADGVSWATIHDSDGNYIYKDSVSGYCWGLDSDNTSDEWDTMIRAIFGFDTSSIGGGKAISAATLSFYGSAKLDDLSCTPNLNVYTANPATDNNIIAGDYDTGGAVAQCDTAITYAGWSTSGYNDFILNATGKSYIDKSGVTNFMTRNASYDAADSPPSWSSDNTSGLSAYFADNGSNKPKLVVIYTVSGGAVFFHGGLATA